VTEEAFAALVHRLEGVAKASPGAYRLRVGALAALAYVYVFAALGVALALLALLAVAVGKSGRVNAGFVKIGFALLAFVFGVGRALWVRFEPPSGIPLRREKLPKLFERIDAVRTAVGAPRALAVLLTEDFNAAVAQRPRLGVLGWQKNHLLLGLPLLRALSAPEFEAVLAHEFGHLSGAHGRLGGWIYRSRTSWGRLLEQMEKNRHWASFVFVPFFRWYAPYFNAYSFVQARAQEYEADRAGARVSGSRAMADALLVLETRGAGLAEYWHEIGARVAELPEPTVRPYTDLRFGAADSSRDQAAVQRALAEPTSLADTHPALRERLAALGEDARVPPLAATSAADVLLGAEQAALCAELDRAWRDQVHEGWTRGHREAQAARRRLAELAGRGEALSDDELFERAQLSEQIEGREAALARYREVVARDARHASAALALGRLLLEDGDEAGLEWLERSIGRTAQAILPATQRAVPFLRERGRQGDAERWIARARTHQQRLEEARQERASVPFDGRYDAHGLEAEALRSLVLFLRTQRGVKRAWVVRRRVRHFPESPLFVLGVQRSTGLWEWSARGRRRRDVALRDAVAEAPLPGEFFAMTVRARKPRRLFTGVAGSQVYPPV
jgi:Zn-dependent protease with chaperone function